MPRYRGGVTQRGLPDKLSAFLRRRPVIVAVALVVLVGAGLWIGLAGFGGRPEGPAPVTPPVAAPPPAGGLPSVVDLNAWKLTIPAEKDNGNAASVQPAAATPPWLTVNPDGALDFWAPTSGATTENSDHPRTELVSLTNFKAGQGLHTLKASTTVVQQPKDGQGIILGQIHGADDISSVPYVMLRYQDNGVKVIVKQVQDGDDHINYQLLNNVPLNSRFDFTIIDLGNGNLGFTGTAGGQTQNVTAPIPAEFKGATVRFQAGDYQQADEPAGGQDGGRVVFHALTESTTAP
jgi:hypothetical protein